MFETIAMICYLSLVEPQISIEPEFDKEVLLVNFTGGGTDPGGDTDDNPKKGDNNISRA